MSKKIKIVADSTCDISPELQQKYGIEIHPFIVNLGEKSYRDGVDIATSDILKYYRDTGNVSKTAAASPSEYEAMFRQWNSDEYDVLFFTISSGFSSAYANARLAAEELDNIYVVESANLSTGILLVVLAAADMIESGMTAKEIAEKIPEITPKVRASFVIDTLEFLWKGGRCSGVAALGANLLKLKPCIEVIDGGMSVGKKYRGNIDKVIPQYIKDRLASTPNVVRRRVFITHTFDDRAPVEAALKQARDSGMFDEVLETRAGCTIYSHCGPNTLGILYIEQ
ncbi:MAG: DegV family protein [Clostridia bacterium]|nr:DegV family protein [Clostridia bacterium]